MSLPAFTQSGVLPPFIGEGTSAHRSPYIVTMVDVVRRFGTTPRRRAILRGLLEYRKELRRIGVHAAFQWVNGSFAENIPREPNDIDVITCAEQLPRALDLADRELFEPNKTKQKFLCDAYLVQLSIANKAKLVERLTYWFGLFSHRRGSYEWKGLIQVGLDDVTDDSAAASELDALEVQF